MVSRYLRVGLNFRYCCQLHTNWRVYGQSDRSSRSVHKQEPQACCCTSICMIYSVYSDSLPHLRSWIVHMWGQADKNTISLREITLYGWKLSTNSVLTIDRDSECNLTSIERRVTLLQVQEWLPHFQVWLSEEEAIHNGPLWGDSAWGM